MADDGVALGRQLPSPLSQPFPQHSHVILQQLNLQRHYGVFCDVVLRVDRYEFRAHKCVLAAGCPKLQTLLYSMQQDTSNVLSLKHLTVTGCRYILDFLYTGSLELKAMHVAEVSAAAKYLEIKDIERACQDYQYYKGIEMLEESHARQEELSQIDVHMTSVSEDMDAHTPNTPSPTLPPLNTMTDYPSPEPPAEPLVEQSYRAPSVTQVEASDSNVHSPGLNDTHDSHEMYSPQLHQSHSSNLSFDTHYIEDYLKLIETMQHEQTSTSQLNRQYIDGQSYSNSHLTSTQQPAKSLTFPGVGPNSTQFSAEDVRKTVLSVLSQEKFGDDDQDVSLTEDRSFTKHAASSQHELLSDSHCRNFGKLAVSTISSPVCVSSMSPVNRTCSLPSIAHIVASSRPDAHSAPSQNTADINSLKSLELTDSSSSIETMNTKPLELKSPSLESLKSPFQKCNDFDSVKTHESKSHHDQLDLLKSRDFTLLQSPDMTVLKSESGDNMEDSLCDGDSMNEESLSDKCNGFLPPKLACKQKRKKKTPVRFSDPDTITAQKHELDEPQGEGSEDGHGALQEAVDTPRVTRLQQRLVRRKRRYDCDKCGRQFEREDGLVKHRELHERELLYSCHICGLKYARSGELTRHLRKHSASSYVCKPCHATFKDPKEYKKHMTEVHSEERPFRCQFVTCNFTADKPSLLDKHIAIHSDVKMYACPKCTKEFAQPNGLRSHLKSCLQQRSYLCDICGSKFNHLQSLKSHRMLHTGEKPHICTDCGARFTDHRNFKRHRRIHENLFPYPCSYCEKRFRHSNSLKAHFKTHGVDASKLPPIVGETSATGRRKKSQQAQEAKITMETQDTKWSEKELVIPVTTPL